MFLRLEQIPPLSIFHSAAENRILNFIASIVVNSGPIDGRHRAVGGDTRASVSF
jgi:hypothetical protein